MKGYLKLSVIGLLTMALSGTVGVMANEFETLQNINTIKKELINQNEGMTTKEELVKYLEETYNINIEFNETYPYINEKYNLMSTEMIEEKDGYESWEYKNVKNLDNEQSQVEMLLAVKEAFAQYTPEAFERIPKVIMLRAKEYQNGSDIGGVTFIVDDEPKLMTLYYEVGKYQGWNYLDWYRVTINHEIFHCLDEFVYKTDFIWENLEEDCHNVSNYACIAGREEKAETWARYLINNNDKNPIKLDYLMSIYGDYLKENPYKGA